MLKPFPSSGQPRLDRKPGWDVDSAPVWAAATWRIAEILGRLSVRGRDGELTPDAGFLTWRDMIVDIRSRDRAVYFVGNGASASMASHMAADLAKNAHVHAQVFTDLSLLTAVANDISYEEVYAEPLRRRMRPGDLLVAISSSGNSPNIVRAAEAALALDGAVVTLSAMKPENSLRSFGDLNFWVPAATYGLAETCHAAILHYWVDLITDMVQ
jgi:D-sedoheptulose 7-phosphate isomerase